jgi:hypothetical protein
MAGACHPSFLFPKHAYRQLRRQGLPFLRSFQEKGLEYLGFIFQQGISLAQHILPSQ